MKASLGRCLVLVVGCVLFLQCHGREGGVEGTVDQEEEITAEEEVELTVEQEVTVEADIFTEEDSEEEIIAEVEVDVEEEIMAEEEIAAEEEEIVAEPESAPEEGSLVPELTNMDDVDEPGYICSRLSPKEVFHMDVHPRLIDILDEFSHFVESVLDRLEESLKTLIPLVDQSPIGKLGVEDLFEELRRFMLGSMRDVYNVIRVAWRELIISQVQLQAHPEEVSPADVLQAFLHVKEAQEDGERRLVAGLQEMSVTLKAVIFNSVYSVGVTLQLPNNTDEHEAAIAINKKIPQFAPNFLGTLMSSLIHRGSDPSDYKKILTDPFRSINPLVQQLYESLEEFVENGGGEDSMEDYWRSAIRAAYAHLRDDPIRVEDYRLIYQNEEYLNELVLELMATF